MQSIAIRELNMRNALFGLMILSAATAAVPALAADCDAMNAAGQKLADASDELQKRLDNYNAESDNDLVCGSAKKLQSGIKSFLKKYGDDAAACDIDTSDFNEIERFTRLQIINIICK